MFWLLPATLLLVSTASAASLGGAAAQAIGAGAAAVDPCDTDGFTATYTTSGGNVTHVTIGGIADPGCEGGSLRVTLTDADGASLASSGPATIATDADTSPNSLQLAVSPQPAAGGVGKAHVSISGP
jgi:hypothetical protein